MVKLMKSRLQDNHETIQLPSVFFAISSKNVIKNHPISGASRVHNFQLQNPKLYKVIDLFLLILKI